MDSCPAGVSGSSGRSGDAAVWAGGESEDDRMSSSKPESLSLDMILCFLCRAVCRCWAGVSASDCGDARSVLLRLYAASELPSQFKSDTISSVRACRESDVCVGARGLARQSLGGCWWRRWWEFPSRRHFPGIFPALTACRPWQPRQRHSQQSLIPCRSRSLPCAICGTIWQTLDVYRAKKASTVRQ